MQIKFHLYPGKILFVASFLFAMVQLAFSQNKGYIIPANVFYVDANVAPYNKVLPGDTLYFQAGSKDYLGIVNFAGNAAHPIVMINLGGEIIIDTNHYYGISIKNCRFIHFTGTGFAGSTYGFKVNRVAAGAGMEIGYLSSDFEVDHVSIQNTSVAGLYAKTDPDCTPITQRKSFTQYNTIIHDNYVANTVDEGMYIGSSKYLGEPIVCNGKDSIVMPSLLDGVKVYNNIVTHTGWDAIQVGCAYRNCAIYNNTITFDSDAGIDTQMSGIMINYGTKADCYNNYISDGKGDGIDCLGLGGTRIFNNIIVNPGLTYYPGNFTLPKHGMFVSDASVQKDSSFYIFNNNIINPKSEGIRFSSVNSKGNLISSNVIINPGAYDYYQSGNTSFKGIDSYVMIQNKTTLVTLRNNYFQRNGSSAGFASSNIHLPGDFALLVGSPLIDAADTDPKASATFDFANQVRPYGAKSDIGAYEYEGTIITRTGGTIASNQSVCQGSLPAVIASISAASGFTGIPEYKWQSSVSGATGGFTDIPNSNTLTYAPGMLTSTTWFVRLARTSGAADWNGAASSNTAIVTVNPLPAATAGTDRSVIPGTATQIGGPALTGSSYSWTSSPAGFTSTAANPTVAPLVATIYTVVEQIMSTGCSNTHNIIISMGSQPAAVAGSNRSICLNTGTQIGASPLTGNTYNWTTNPVGFTSTLANPVVYPIVTTTYILTETNTATGSTNSHSVVVTVNPLPVAAVGSNRVICLNSSTQIGAIPITGNTYSWTSSPAGFAATLSNPVVSPLVTTTYSIVETVTATGCSWSHNVVVAVNPVPAAISGTDRSIIPGTSTQLGTTANSGSSYSWTSSPAGFTSTVANPSVSPVSTTNYTLVETVIATGCTNSHSVTVSINSLPAAVVGSNRGICLNTGTQIGASPVTGNTYRWTSNPAGFISTEANPLVYPTVNTTYTLVETNIATGSSNSHSVVVTVNPLPGTASTITGPTAVSPGSQNISYSISPITNATNYVWSFQPGATITSGAGSSAIIVNFPPNVAPGIVTVYGSNSCGISNTSSLALTSTPVIAKAGNISGLNIACQGSKNLTYSVAPIPNANSYTWNIPAGATIVAGANTNSIVIDLSQNAVSGQISVYGYNGSSKGEISPAFFLEVSPLISAPTISVSGLNLISSALAGNQWYYSSISDGYGTVISGATSQIYTPTKTGYYWLLTTLNTCGSLMSNKLFRLNIDEADRYNVYPVPNKGLFTVSITTSAPEIYTIQVFNQSGIEIIEIPGLMINGEFKQEIDLQHVSSGVYLIVMKSNLQNISNRKIEIIK